MNPRITARINRKITVLSHASLARTMMVTLTNGIANSGYIPNGAAFGYLTFEVLSSRCKPGYAESAIVNGILDLMAGAAETR